ncbi:MAG: hypothetical protein HYX25_07625 [Candidatus Solibacter usitatus]|nr:hypothetical protein [Candidatus Solibacter usitatus]
MKLAAWILLAACTAWSSPLKPVSSAEACGRCHRAILQSWKLSAHADAMESSVFQDSLDLAEADFGAASQKICLACHSPLAAQTGDSALLQKVSWEGITCDYCHSIRSVDFAGPNPKAKVELSLVKSGPLKNSTSMAHGTVFSSVHTSSEICAPCHEYRNATGLPVLTTYSEWKASRYAKEGKNCQSCHMYRVAGDVVDPKIRAGGAERVNLHQMPGGHSLEQLTRTIKARLDSSRQGDQLKVTVTVSNQAAGHFVPTGSPLRQLVLDVRVDTADSRHFAGERTYRRVVGDQHGTPVNREHFAFVKAAKTLGDTRLAPDETRKEEFTYTIKPGVQTNIKATLSYVYSPLARTESQQHTTFLSLSKIVY